MKDFVDRWLFNPVTGRLVAALLGIVVVIAAVRLLQRALSHRIKESETRYRVRKSVAFGGYILAVVVLSVVFSDKLGNLTVALGVAGAGIAFSLQEVIASIAGWFAISLAGFYKVGNRVQLGGIKGDVIDIGILRTTLMEVGEWVKGDLYNGRIVRIANSFVLKEPVFNYSADFPFLWDEITIPVRHGSDHRLAREILYRAVNDLVGSYARQAETSWKSMVEKFNIEEARVQPMVTLVVNDNWLEFTIRYVVDYKARRSTRDALFTRILDDIGKTGGRVAIASATFELVAGSRLDVRLLNRDGNA
jgi:small-conductance mechanosensitive channel